MELSLVGHLDRNIWDKEISRFDTVALFHRSAWLNFIKRSQGGGRLLLEIREKGEICGYFTGFIIRKGPFRILGSPLIGWTTEFMGPIVNHGFDQEAFLKAMEEYCRHLKIDQLELSNPILEPEIMQAHGFQCRREVTPIVNLSPDEEAMWRNLNPKSCRYPIRRALKNGVEVEETHDPRIIDEYYDQLTKIFVRQGIMPTYQRDRVQSLFECLKEEDMLFALWAKHKNRVIATGLFPHDEHCVYYWGGSSSFDYRSLCPNELIQWTLMVMASEKGIKLYDMYGGSNHFKLKFGARLADVFHWYKSYNPLAKIARSVYQHQFKAIQRIRGFVRKNIIST